MDDFTSLDTNGLGYVYVLTNPAMPGQVKVGKTQRHPTQRAQELSGATGVPASFEIAFYKQFEDCAIAEKLVQIELTDMGLKTSRNKEFFSCEVSKATAIIEAVYVRLESKDSQVDCDRLVAHAEALLASENPSVVELTQALALWEYAHQLGHLLAGYFAAHTALQLMERKSADSMQEALLERRAIQLLESSAEAGVVRAWADLALLRHWQKNENASKGCWTWYFATFGDESPPEEELQYLAELLHKHYFAKNTPVSSMLFLKNNKIAIKAAFKYYPTDPQYIAWLKQCCWNKVDFLVERARLPVLALLGWGLLYLASSAWAFGFLFLVGMYLLIFKRKKKK